MPYLRQATTLNDVYLLTPRVHSDARGFFLESFHQEDFAQATGLNVNFVQDNHSLSHKNVLRGLHYQIEQPQGKLLRVLAGEIFDVAVDLRESSPTFGRWQGFYLQATSPQLLWLPVGFAHGFLVLSEQAEVLYKTTDYYCRAGERSLRWSDPTLAIHWPLTAEPLLSEKDAEAPFWSEVSKFA